MKLLITATNGQSLGEYLANCLDPEDREWVHSGMTEKATKLARVLLALGWVCCK